MKEVLLGMHEVAYQWRQRGAMQLPLLEREEWWPSISMCSCVALLSKGRPRSRSMRSHGDDTNRATKEYLCICCFWSQDRTVAIGRGTCNFPLSVLMEKLV